MPLTPNEMLNAWCCKKRGNTAVLALACGAPHSLIARMRIDLGSISLHMAMLIERATGGELRADLLCPENAELINYFRTGVKP